MQYHQGRLVLSIGTDQLRVRKVRTNAVQVGEARLS